jgi:hypothetical protein
VIGAKEVMKRVSPSQKALLHLLHKERDVLISRLYAKLANDKTAHRYMQQRVGVMIWRLNHHLVPLGYVIKPGEKRRTYRLRPITAQG